MGWTSYHICDWCSSHSEECLRDDSLSAAGWRYVGVGYPSEGGYVSISKHDSELICNVCVVKYHRFMELAKKAPR